MTATKIQITLAPGLSAKLDGIAGELRDIRLLLSRVAWNQAVQADRAGAVMPADNVARVATVEALAPVEASAPAVEASAVRPRRYLASAPTAEPRWSVARDDVILRDYPAGVVIARIVERLNSLSGPAVTAAHVYGRTGYLRVLRSLPAAEPVPAPAPEAAPSAPAPAPAPAPAAAAAIGGASRQPRWADFATIAQWAAQRGIIFDGDVGPVNACAIRVGLAPFILDRPHLRRLAQRTAL